MILQDAPYRVARHGDANIITKVITISNASNNHSCNAINRKKNEYNY